MCGIAGYYLNDTLNGSHIHQMTSAIQHRGPDFTDHFSDQTIALGHCRLSIIDLSSDANQPMTSASGRYILVYNGEVYNFKEIAQELGLNPKSKSDTEVILLAYEKLGEDFVEKLNGMFAIAIYDKEEKSLRCWRDRFGIKPFYYYWDGQNFAFASELKALLQLPFSKTIDQESISNYLFFEYIPQPKTPFKNFCKLGNGCFLDFKEKKVSISKYYDILDKVEDPLNISENEALEEFTSKFDQSVKYRTISDVPLGAFLSGGNDSSAVCMSLRNQNFNVNSFSIGFDNPTYDESKYAIDMSELLDTSHSNQIFSVQNLLEDFEKITSIYDEPFAVSSVFPTYKVSQACRSKIKVAMSGDGGDELFMGYGHYQWYQRLQNLDSIVGKGLRKGLSKTFRFLPSKYARVSSLLNYDRLSTDWPHIWSQEQYMFSENEISRLANEAFHNETLRADWQKIVERSNNYYQAISLFDLRHYLADDLLYKVDMASMANGLEVRLPFLDHNLVEFVLNLPSEMKFKSGNQKHLLKKYLKNQLPQKAVDRTKWGFGAPVDAWMKKELKAICEEKLKSLDEFDSNQISTLLAEFYSGKHYLYKRIWALFVYATWKEKYA